LHPRSFEYVCPRSVDDAVALIAEYGGKAKLLAGGQSLIPIMKFRFASPQVIVDLNRIPDLSGIHAEGNTITIGAMTRHQEIEHSQTLRQEFPLLADAAALLADPLVRNRGTMGGSLAHADPASDWGTCLLALGAELGIRGSKGSRTVAIDAFFKDTFTTALAPDELLTHIRLAKPAAHSGSAFTKLKRKTGDFATVSAAVTLTLGGSSKFQSVRMALGGVGPTPLRAHQAEKALEGASADPSALAHAAQLAAQDARPSEDLRGSVAYKRAMAEVYAQRALGRALDRAQGRNG
jgi:aerobic carbon-monoxide dehydrogenase medium subunit